LSPFDVMDMAAMKAVWLLVVVGLVVVGLGLERN
jgi:hypothetical protein